MEKKQCAFRTSIGGQALIEGILMRGPEKQAIVVRSPEGELSLDATGKKSGRGAYICRCAACLEKALKTKGLERSLKCEIPESVRDELRKEMAELE